MKVMWTREDDVHNGRFRPLSAHRLKAGFDAAGKLVAWHHRLVGDRVTPFFDPVRYERAGKQRLHPHARRRPARAMTCPHQLVEQIYEDTGVRTAPLRGISFIANKFATETFLDEIARKRGIDPVKFRLELLHKTPRAAKGGRAGGARWRTGAASADGRALRLRLSRLFRLAGRRHHRDLRQKRKAPANAGAFLQPYMSYDLVPQLTRRRRHRRGRAHRAARAGGLDRRAVHGRLGARRR